MQITNKYEKMFASVETAMNVTEKLDEIIEIIKRNKSVTAMQIAEMLDISKTRATYTLNRLYDSGKIDKKIMPTGKVNKVIKCEWVVEGIPEYIQVHDDEGHTYNMRNPRYENVKGSWKDVEHIYPINAAFYFDIGRLQ